ncbi:hypothetical protein GJ496_011710 [Pomphorhynchus laevis]|nr:hypothetical protein GJ496_011710 [Pomphorhynchus laevis]
MCNLASDASVANIHRCLSPFKNSSAFVKSSTANRDKVTKDDTIKQFRSNQYAQQQACTSVSTRKEPNKNKHQIQNSSVNLLVKPSSNLACTSDNKDDGDNDLASARPLLAEEIASASLEIPLLSTAGNNFDDNIITDDGSSSCGDNNADGDNDSNMRKGSVISADCSMPSASINCWTQDGSNICMFIGIIDILQHYRLQKRLEHILRTSVLAHKDISVCDPQYYSTRFINFISTKVFRKSRCPLPPTYYYNDGGLAEAQIPSLLSFGVEPTIYSENLSTISSDARYAYGDGYMTAHRYTSSSIAPSSSTRKSIRRQQHNQNGDNKKRYWTTLSRTATITNNTSSLVSNYGDFDIVGVNNANDKAGATKHTPLSAKSKRIRNSMLLSEENVEASNPPSEISILHSNKQYNRCHNRLNLNTDSNTEGVRNFTGSCADSCYGCSSSVLSFNNTNKWPQHVPDSDKLLFTKHNNRCKKDDKRKSPTAYRNCSVTKATRRNYQGDMPLPRD